MHREVKRCVLRNNNRVPNHIPILLTEVIFSVPDGDGVGGLPHFRGEYVVTWLGRSCEERKKKIIYQYLIHYFFGLVSCLPSAVTYCLQEIFVPSTEDELFYII